MIQRLKEDVRSSEGGTSKGTSPSPDLCQNRTLQAASTGAGMRGSDQEGSSCSQDFAGAGLIQGHPQKQVLGSKLHRSRYTRANAEGADQARNFHWNRPEPVPQEQVQGAIAEGAGMSKGPPSKQAEPVTTIE